MTEPNSPRSAHVVIVGGGVAGLEELRELAELRFGVADTELLSEAVLERLAAARAANLRSRSRSIRAMALYVSALGVLGAQVLLIAIVHLLGI